MYDFLKNFHSGWAYLVVLLSVILIVAMVYHFATKKPLHRNIRKVSFYTILSFHIQFLVGLGLYFVSPVVNSAWENGTAMQNGIRLFTVEHPLMMFTAVILMTVANAKIKKTQYVTTSILIFLFLGAVCFYMIPWTQWLNG